MRGGRVRRGGTVAGALRVREPGAGGMPDALLVLYHHGIQRVAKRMGSGGQKVLGNVIFCLRGAAGL